MYPKNYSELIINLIYLRMKELVDNYMYQISIISLSKFPYANIYIYIYIYVLIEYQNAFHFQESFSIVLFQIYNQQQKH